MAIRRFVRRPVRRQDTQDFMMDIFLGDRGVREMENMQVDFPSLETGNASEFISKVQRRKR